MVDRSYLPYKSAREYIDRGMAKWMGFFLSEHSASLSKEWGSSPVSHHLGEEEKLFFLSQAFFCKREVLLYTRLEKEPYLGIVSDLSGEKVYLKTLHKVLSFSLSEILFLTLAEKE